MMVLQQGIEETDLLSGPFLLSYAVVCTIHLVLHQLHACY